LFWTSRLDNESGCDGREQTRLPPRKVRITIKVNTRERTDAHEDQGGVQVFIIFVHEVTVVLIGFSLGLVIELDASAASHPEEAWKERWRCLEHHILLAGKEGNTSVKD